MQEKEEKSILIESLYIENMSLQKVKYVSIHKIKG